MTDEHGDSAQPPASHAPKEYIGFIWIGDEPGIRLSVMAHNPTEAYSTVVATYGEGHVISVWNEEDANGPRCEHARRTVRPTTT